jgi:hypothetical protein
LIAAKILLPPCTASPAFTAGAWLARAALAWKIPEKEREKTGVSVLALHSHIKCKVNQRLFVFRGAALAALPLTANIFLSFFY